MKRKDPAANARFTPVRAFNLNRAVVLLCLSALALSGQGGSSQTRPGAIDPAGNPSNLTLFRDQQVFAMSPGTKTKPWQTAGISFDAALTPSAALGQLPGAASLGFSQLNIQAAAGRILHPEKDDIVIVQRSPSDGTKLTVSFSDGNQPAISLGPLAARIPNWTDFFSTSVGDLDRLYDAKGEYHDEVVVAWAEVKDNHNLPMQLHVAVLNYSAGSDPTVTTASADLGVANGTYVSITGFDPGYCCGQVPWFNMPLDNILATAIGDFDGDGYNEIAVASLETKITSDGYVATVTVRILRYKNDGTNGSLDLVNKMEIPQVDFGPGWAGTLSIAAGDFDGTGIDQLLLGTVSWSGTDAGDGSSWISPFFNSPVLFLIKGGQIAAATTSATGTGGNNSGTELTMSLGGGAYIPRTVTLTGGTGKWAAVNGTWAATLTAKGFSISVDSSNFGSFTGQSIYVSAAAPLTQARRLDFTALQSQTGPVQMDGRDRDARIRVQLIPGLFHFDPAHGYDYRRRQVAVAWNARPYNSAQSPDAHLAIVQITKDDQITFAARADDVLNGFQTYQTLAVAAGAFRGSNDTNDPTWSLFVAGVGQRSPGLYSGLIHTIWKVVPDSSNVDNLQLQRICAGKASFTGNSKNTDGIDAPYCPIWGTDATIDVPDGTPAWGAFRDLRVPAIAADPNGDSLKLGAPVHFTVRNPAKAQFVLEQPPQHAAWLDLGGTEGPQVVTINRFPSFNTAMEDSAKKDFASKNQDHTDWTVGGSEKLTASATWAEGVDAGSLEDVSEKTTARLGIKVAYDYNHVSSQYDSNYDSYTVGRNATTGEDDSLLVESQMVDIWRYRIYGQATSTDDPNKPYAFYDIALPGPSLLSNPGGRDVDWYQPVHEVGNVLSYPGIADVCTPPDIGPITIPNTNISNKVIPLIGCSEQFYNGNSSTLSLALDHQTGSGGSADYTHKLQADLNFKLTYQVDFEILGNGGQATGSSETDIHGGADWGHLNTSDNSTTDATGITVNSPQGDSEHAYPYYPILYNTTAGGLKAAYAVGDLTSSNAGGAFWKDNYGSKPDPALNLPNRFVATYSSNGILDGWAPNKTIVRKRMKGFVVRKAALDSVTGIYPLLGSNPHDGDTVMLDARVYNYSISATATGPITVQFSVIGYDSDTDNEICVNIPTTGKGGRVCPASARTIIGTGSPAPTGGAKTISLNGRENAEVYLMWSTKGFGPKSAGVKEYRLYADLISDANGPGELYPAEAPCATLPCEDEFGNQKIVDPGQNNEGWSLISVAPPAIQGVFGNSPSSATRGTLTAQSSVFEGRLGLDAVDAAGKCKAAVQAYLFQPLHMRITAFSNVRSPLHGQVTIFDGKRGKRETATIAGKILLGMDPDGSSAWFDWTPRKKGPHHLYAIVQGANGTMPLGDLLVHVRRAPGDLNEDGRVDRHDLNMLSTDFGKTVAESACGVECDLDGDGMITQSDADEMAQLCDSQMCAFAKAEYVGGPSPLEPNMREIRSSDETAITRFLADYSEDSEQVNAAQAQSAGESALYHAELKRKQEMQNIRYYYKGQLVKTGLYATQAAPSGKH